MIENKRFGFESFEISKTDRFLDEVKLYEIDKNHSDDLDESDLFYVYSDSEVNIIQLVDKLNELNDENKELQQKNKELIKYVHQLEIALKKKGD